MTLGPLACLPQKGNGVLNATVSPEIPGASTRLYFRRMNVEVEDFYYIEMEPAGGGGYWSTFPVPTESKFPKQKLDNYNYEGQKIDNNGKPWAEWWRAKEGSQARNPNDDLDKDLIRERAALGKGEKRVWMQSLDDAALQNWLDNLKTEAGEYFVAVVDGSGKLLGRSEMRSVEVTQGLPRHPDSAAGGLRQEPGRSARPPPGRRTKRSSTGSAPASPPGAIR